MRIVFEGASYSRNDGETVLDALIRGGANIPFSCRKGSCHCCLMKATHGDPGPRARRGLSDTVAALGYFLPCQAENVDRLWAERPDPSELFTPAHVVEVSALSSGLTRVLLEPETNTVWQAGQSVGVRRRTDGLVRTYSLSSVAQLDYYLEIHVQEVPGGRMSPWLRHKLSVGDVVDIGGPTGTCVYRTDEPDAPLLLIATGSGLGALFGLARDALRQGHRGPISLYHGARNAERIYLSDAMQAVAMEHPNFTFRQCITGETASGELHQGRATTLAFEEHTDLTAYRVFLCGNPDMVYEARVDAVRGGAARDRIHADAFETSEAIVPRDAEKLAAYPAELELWAALDDGDGLTTILEDFYTRAFEDPRLAPFFHGVTKARAIEKQYEFLRRYFTGGGQYLGFRPFNAHHWMVISNELFDYREARFDESVRRYGLAPHLHRRWAAFHELFRRELVKAAPRGVIHGGTEIVKEGYNDEIIEVATICDGCLGAHEEGAHARMLRRTGELYCDQCASRDMSASDIHPAV